jgi:hypothetical protein
MRQQTFAMHFRGQASRAGADTQMLHITSSGTSSTFETKVTGTGFESSLHATEGDLVFFEADVRLNTPQSFEGRSTLTFGDEGEHCLRMMGVGPGHLAPIAEAGLIGGAVTWRIEGGDGRLSGARGFVSSVFTLTDSGELNDYHCGLILLPE